ncbi:MAG TPA: TIGR00282 family metallophosphoesterase [candidate division WOR-3 bacterium]|uniref:TIGR00282 family metallophosphoesterase n=1 Tax=candidate division WOR-3 bacterium TaxID=2052148 RepID=A0A7V0T7E0_UNCW3|nr:TIGR00282 family metallophosphoesterase [candidate division WOR-3 bacterium]
MPTRRIVFLGDVCSRAGRDAVVALLPGIRERHRADFVVVNAENVAGGYGINPTLCEELLAAGADCLTTGDHAFDRRDTWDYYNIQSRLLRPANYPPGAPGRGQALYGLDGWAVGVISLVGRVFMKPLDCPFRRVESCLEQLGRQAQVLLVDFHAEATAEKQAMGWYLDGRVSAVVGTHTHVQTADERVLPGGTAYITDAGMCGAFDSVLGMRREDSLKRLLDGLPHRLTPARGEPAVSGVVVEVDGETGRATGIERLLVEFLPSDEDKPAGDDRASETRRDRDGPRALQDREQALES